MKKNKAFTLVELIATIALIGLISTAIAVPILAQINSSSSKLDEITLDLLYTTTDLYMKKYSNTYDKVNGNIYYVTVEQLIENKLLEENFLSSYSSKVLTKNTQIKVSVVDNAYKYELPDEQLINIYGVYNNISTSNKYDYVEGTYLKGSLNNNYVLYNGFIWRIMGVNKDNSIRLIMDQHATSIIYDDNGDYSNSYIRNWLNDYFISRLQYNGIIKKQKWYYKAISSSNVNVDTSIYVEDKVGLLSVEEYNLSLLNSDSYLKDGITSGLLNQSEETIYVMQNGINVSNVNNPLLVKPIINVLGSTIVSGGTGNYSDPYILAEYKNDKTNLSLKDANVTVGSYINVDSKTYRIVEKDSEKVKLISYFNPEKYSNYADDGYTYNLTNGSGNLLNTQINSDKFLKNNIFLGEIYSAGSNYKNTIFAKKNIVYDTYISLPIMGELLTSIFYPSAIQPSCYWTLTLKSSNEAYKICNNGITSDYIYSYDSANANNYTLVYTVYISLDNIIVSGDGTSDNPYTI